MDQRDAELNPSSISNTTRSVFCCAHDPQLVWDLYDTTSPWIFAAVASIMSPTAVLLNVLVIIEAKQRKELQRASNILLSSMAVTDLLVGSLCVPLSAVVGSLSNSDRPLHLQVGLCSHIVHNHSCDLLDFPSDNDCLGKVRGHSKVD